MIQIPRYNGWIPDKPDHRDVPYKALRGGAKQLFKAVVRPTLIDLRGAHFPIIFDQGTIGSCVAQAWAAAIAYAISKEDFEKEGYEPFVMSRLFLYYHARGGVPVDQGAYIRDGIKMVAEYGACLENPYWPYVTSKWADKPSPEAYVEAEHRKYGLSYYRLDTLGDMLDCLAEGYPIVFGASIFESFERLSVHNDVVKMPRRDEAPLGGHAMVIVGYDLKRKLFLVRNSWGERWGNKGYCWFPFEYLTHPNLAADFWTVRKIAK